MLSCEEIINLPETLANGSAEAEEQTRTLQTHGSFLTNKYYSQPLTGRAEENHTSAQMERGELDQKHETIMQNFLG